MNNMITDRVKAALEELLYSDTQRIDLYFNTDTNSVKVAAYRRGTSQIRIDIYTLLGDKADGPQTA